MATVFFAKTNPYATIPSKRDEDAGFDLYACFKDDFVKFEPFENKVVNTGVAVALKKHFYMQIEERSSTGSKGLKKNSGVVDSGYRGEIMISLFNANSIPLYISKLPKEEIEKREKGQFIYFPYTKAIAQGVIHKLPKLRSKEIPYSQLKSIASERKEGGFGSTKK